MSTSEKVDIDYDRLKAFLEGLYYVYARRELVYPDPLYFLYDYEDIRDREIVGLIASSLAYGRVAQIMKSVERVLSCLGSRPYEFLLKHGNEEIVPDRFQHRFTASSDMNNLLQNIRTILATYGSLQALLSMCLSSQPDFLSALDAFTSHLSVNTRPQAFPLIPSPAKGSPAKRLFLYLRWLIRSDSVDPGGWNIISPSQLLVPCDTHMHRIASHLGLTSIHQPSLKAAQEITSAFSVMSPEDPAKYDFVLTRFGIRTGLPKSYAYSVVK